MDEKNLRRRLGILAILFSAFMINSRAIFKNPGIPTPDMLSLIAIGVLIGVFIMTLREYLALKKKVH